MKIFEITLSTDIKKISSIDDVVDTFKKYGWEFVGSGSESAVGFNPTKKYVLKVFLASSLYHQYVKLSNSHPQNPHFSKFFGNVKVVPGNPRWLFVRIEKLDKISGNIYLLYPAEFFYLCELTYQHDLPLKLGFEVTKKIDGVAKQKFSTNLIVDGQFNKNIWNHTNLPSKSWQEACNLLVKTAAKNNYNWIDANPDNFMLRDSTLVFIDPFWQ